MTGPAPLSVHARRRTAFLAALGDEAALLFGRPHHIRNGDAEYRYRPSSDLHYLTGWEDPEVAALFRPGAEHPFVLFVQPKDPVREIWTGHRPGVEGARERFEADAAFPIGELPSRLTELLQGWSTLHYAFGDDAERDRALGAALRGAARPAARNGLDVPWRFIDPARLVGEQRLIKTPDEIAALRSAANITIEAHIAAMRLGRPGVHEYEIEAEIEGIFRRSGGTGAGYTTIVGGGANATVLHYIRNRDALPAANTTGTPPT